VVGKVGDQKFEGSNVQECLHNASVSLGVPAEKLAYSILEEKKGLFRKHAVISIDAIKGLNSQDTHVENSIGKNAILEDVNGTVEIKDGRIIIKNPKEGGRPAIISTMNNITVTVNGEKVSLRTMVYEESKIEVVFNEDSAKRHMNLRTSSDKMEAYVSITYKPKTTYKLKDIAPGNAVLLEIDVKEEIMPPKFTESEIKNELLNHNIKYGILKMHIVKCAEAQEISELLIAKGKKTIDGIDDRLEIKYNEPEEQNLQKCENSQVIDYKAIGSVEGIEKGQVLAILHPGKNGEDGIDITEKTVKAKNVKKIVLGAGEGCELTDEYTVVALSQGKPSVRGNTFFVYKTHEINGDVELKTGNIKFVGDIIIHGSVKEGMKVEAGNSILVKNNIAEAEITANGDVVVKGNVIHSNVAAGKEDVLTLEYLTDLKGMKSELEKLISSIKQLKEMNLLEKHTSDGEFIKILLETKFKRLPQTCIKVSKRIMQLQNNEDELIFIIKHRILGLGPLNIKSYEELNDAVRIIDNKISVLEMNLTLPVDVVLDYCQDSIIKSSGNITFSGKGQYVSQITARDSVIFQKDKSIARGGVIKASKEIKCKIVGGPGGVATKLIVENHGHIWAEVAYPNTRFIIGSREYVLDVPSKNVHVFVDESRELIVDKLLL
jgi:uncharacterized protein (DUF342 family)